MGPDANPPSPGPSAGNQERVAVGETGLKEAAGLSGEQSRTQGLINTRPSLSSVSRALMGALHGPESKGAH